MQNNTIITCGKVTDICGDFLKIADAGGNEVIVSKPEELRPNRATEIRNGVSLQYSYNKEGSERLAEAPGFETEAQLVDPPYDSSSTILAVSLDGGKSFTDLNVAARRWMPGPG